MSDDTPEWNPKRWTYDPERWAYDDARALLAKADSPASVVADLLLQLRGLRYSLGIDEVERLYRKLDEKKANYKESLRRYQNKVKRLRNVRNRQGRVLEQQGRIIEELRAAKHETQAVGRVYEISASIFENGAVSRVEAIVRAADLDEAHKAAHRRWPAQLGYREGQRSSELQTFHFEEQAQIAARGMHCRGFIKAEAEWNDDAGCFLVKLNGKRGTHTYLPESWRL